MSEELTNENTETTVTESTATTPEAAPVKKRRGRPPGSLNKPKDPNAPKKTRAPKGSKTPKAKKESKAGKAESKDTTQVVDAATVKVVIQAEPELSDDVEAVEASANE